MKPPKKTPPNTWTCYTLSLDFFSSNPNGTGKKHQEEIIYGGNPFAFFGLLVATGTAANQQKNPYVWSDLPEKIIVLFELVSIQMTLIHKTLWSTINMSSI